MMPNFTQRAFAHGKQDYSYRVCTHDDVSHVWNSNTVPMHSSDADGTADDLVGSISMLVICYMAIVDDV